jgi:hypothetical protein
MEQSKIICDICGITCRPGTEYNFSMQIDKTNNIGDYRKRYLFKDLCPRCAGKVLRYISEQQYLYKDFTKHVIKQRRKLEE